MDRQQSDLKMDQNQFSAAQMASKVKIIDPTTQPTVKGPAETFTGDVEVAMLFSGEDPSQMAAGYVCFDCAARSAWHTHPKGQLLVVTQGSGLIQEWGKPIRRIEKGDVIWTPPNVKHWHGASANTSMTHLAIQERLDGKAVHWMEKVTDEEYKGPIEN
jgi:quercetin dioxygenase-like cupin family protein